MKALLLVLVSTAIIIVGSKLAIDVKINSVHQQATKLEQQGL